MGTSNQKMPLLCITCLLLWSKLLVWKLIYLISPKDIYIALDKVLNVRLKYYVCNAVFLCVYMFSFGCL